MAKSLLFLPDLSGFTEFVHNTEVEHSLHVIAELLELLIDANEIGMQLAEIEGDALFFYKENDVPSQAAILSQVERMFTSFNNHLKKFEKHRICPCAACATAPNLKLKVILHIGDIQFIQVKESRKPFGQEVIQVHRLMKNTIPSDNYFLISEEANSVLQLANHQNGFFSFKKHHETYDFGEIDLFYAHVDLESLPVDPIASIPKVNFDHPPHFVIQEEFNVEASKLFEFITNFKYRKFWVDGVDVIEYNEQEINRIGTEHICVIKDNKLNFVTVTKEARSGQLIYGEVTTDVKPIDKAFSFHVITPVDEGHCQYEFQGYLETSVLWKKILVNTIGKRAFKKSMISAVNNLRKLVETSEKSV